MDIVVITGAASGIGQATTKRLLANGVRTIGVDLHNSDVVADLETPQGRETMLSAVRGLAPDGLDGVVAAAGISTPDRPEAVLSINYFGAVATLEELRPMLAQQPARAP